MIDASSYMKHWAIAVAKNATLVLGTHLRFKNIKSNREQDNQQNLSTNLKHQLRPYNAW